MDSKRCVDKAPEQLRQEIEQTKSSLHGHLQNLETEVRKQVAEVKESVGESVENVKRAVDVREHVRQHPKLAVGIAVVAGALVSRFLQEPEASNLVREKRVSGTKPLFVPTMTNAPTAQPQKQSKIIEHLGSRFEQELHQLSGLALGLLFSAAKNWIQKAGETSLGNATESRRGSAFNKIQSQHNGFHNSSAHIEGHSEQGFDNDYH